MNPILDGLPEHVVIDGIKIPINSDFRIWIRLDSILNAGEEGLKFTIDARTSGKAGASGGTASENHTA